MIRIDDLPGAVAWYTEVLGTEPYFAKPSLEAPAYVEFRTGDYEHELGLIDSTYRPDVYDAANPRAAGGTRRQLS